MYKWQILFMEAKGDLNYFEHGMVVSARRTGMSILETDNPLGFSSTSISTGYNSDKSQTIRGCEKCCLL